MSLPGQGAHNSRDQVIFVKNKHWNKTTCLDNLQGICLPYIYFFSFYPFYVYLYHIFVVYFSPSILSLFFIVYIMWGILLGKLDNESVDEHQTMDAVQWTQVKETGQISLAYFNSLRHDSEKE